MRVIRPARGAKLFVLEGGEPAAGYFLGGGEQLLIVLIADGDEFFSLLRA